MIDIGAIKPQTLTDAFAAKYGEEALEEISEATVADDGVCGKAVVLRKEMLNAANYLYTVAYDEHGVDELVIVEVGDWNGFCIIAFGDEAIDYERPRPPQYTFVPRNPDVMLSPKGKIFELWQKEEWFKSKVRDLNYDMMFAPGSKTWTHYSDWAKQKGLKIKIEHFD